MKYLQDATHQMCYMVANSNAINGIAAGSTIKYSLAPWQVGQVVGICVTGLLFLLAIVMTVLRSKDKKRHPELYK